MGDVCDELRFHILTLELFLHSLLKARLYLVKLLLQRLKDSRILRNHGLQISCRQFSGALQQDLIFAPDHSGIFFQHEEENHRVDKQRHHAEISQNTADQNNEQVQPQDLKQDPVRGGSKVDILQCHRTKSEKALYLPVNPSHSLYHRTDDRLPEPADQLHGPDPFQKIALRPQCHHRPEA